MAVQMTIQEFFDTYPLPSKERNTMSIIPELAMEDIELTVHELPDVLDIDLDGSPICEIDETESADQAAAHWSMAVLYIDTTNAEYKLEVGGSWNRLTCLSGTFAPGPGRRNAIDCEPIMNLDAFIRGWFEATRGDFTAANKEAAKLCEAPVIFRFYNEMGSKPSFIVTSEVQDAVWRLT